MRQDKKRYAKNLRVKRDLRIAIKSFTTKPTFDGLKDVQSRIDTAVKKNILKKNNGARQMARMSKIAKESGVKIPKTATKKVTANKVVKKTVTKKSAVKKSSTKK